MDLGLTDEDFDYMASAMWRDLSPPALPSSADEEESAGEKEQKAANISPIPAPVAEMSQSDIKKRPAIKASDWSQNTTNSTKARTKNRTSKKTASLFAELEVSSPVVSAQTKDHNRKLSKSMKGASQNESQLAKKTKMREVKTEVSETHPKKEPTTAPGQDADVYSFPISPTSSGRAKKAMTETKKTPQSIARPKSSPLAPGIQSHLNSLQDKFSKPQKRIAKRSFLDPPETPQPEKEEQMQKAQPAKKAKQQKPEELPASERPKAAAPAKRPTGKSSHLLKELASILPTEEKPAPSANVAAKLRPRRERAPIIISSDPVSSDREENDLEFLDMDYLPDADGLSLPSPGERPQLSEKQCTDSFERASDIDAVNVHETPTVKAAALQTIEDSVEARVKTEKPPSTQKEAAHATDSTSKRRAAPMDVAKTDRLEKKTKLNSDSNSSTQRGAQAQDKTRSVNNAHKKRPGTVRPAAVNDPFMADERDSAQTKFTAKLLKSVGMGNQTAYEAPEVKPNTQRAAEKHERLRSKSNGKDAQHAEQVQPTQQAKQAQQTQLAQREKSDDIARQMMRLFADLDTEGEGENQQQEAKKALWLDETEAYGETGQIMGYVCKTVLRLLKSKEAAIDDVANEYHQRGTIVLQRVEDLHQIERHKLVQQFEQGRQGSLSVFDAACKDVRQLMEKLQKVRLAPVVNSVLADNAVSRLRALQAEVA